MGFVDDGEYSDSVIQYSHFQLTFCPNQIQRNGTLATSFVPLIAAVVSQLSVDFSFSRLWFAALCAATVFSFFDNSDLTSGDARKGMRYQRILTLIAALSFAFSAVLYYSGAGKPAFTTQKGFSDVLQPLPPATPLAPMELHDTRSHPIAQLIAEADVSWQQKLQGQSQTLEAAVAEYRRRYNIPPPPHFDKWFEFAKARNVQMIDEYDTVYKTMLPFWGISPATIRARAREAIGFQGNFLMGLALRDGKPAVVHGGEEWLQQAAVGMIQNFVQYLPDMDLAFNIHDEPRVIVPHDDLSRLVSIALDENMPAILKTNGLRNAFSGRPADVNDGQSFAESKTTRFNTYAHQPVWDPARLSCAPDTPARTLDEAFATDNLTSYALGELGFVYNQTAFNDICNSPSFSRTFGFFDRPNAVNFAHLLYPIFSQSKVSSFNDILYPSPWYWYGKVKYEESRDIAWKAKTPTLLWRGSTTGGFSRNGGWRRQHRQHMVTKLNALDDAKILQRTETPGGESEYHVKSVPRKDYQNRMNVHFSHIGQCDKEDCDAQREFFDIQGGVDQQDHWKWRYLLDLDGNAFSGRFYAFLKSKSLVLKMAVFREWHQEWLRPWVHYVPLSLRGDEVLESVRYFSATGEGGEELAARLAEQGSEWAHKVLRNEDFEVWFFRVLLE